MGSSTASRLSWSPPPEEDRNGLILFYTLILTDLQFNTSNILVNTTNVSYSFTGLQEYARYSCRIAAGTRAGIGPFSPSVYFVTHEDGMLRLSCPNCTIVTSPFLSARSFPHPLAFSYPVRISILIPLVIMKSIPFEKFCSIIIMIYDHSL